MALFESYERRINQINKFLNDNGIASIEEAEKICKAKGLDIYQRVKDIQPICFENACWAYIVGAAIAIKKDCRRGALPCGDRRFRNREDPRRRSPVLLHPRLRRG